MMSPYLVCLTILTHCVLCSTNTTTTIITTTTTEPSTSTSTRLQEQETSTIATRQPRLLKLGNQTVDINKSFRVPYHDITTTTTSTSPTRVTTTVRTWPSSSRQDYEAKHGPRFEDGIRDNVTIIVQAGDTASLDCRVSLLRDKTVSWVRRRKGEAPLLLTVGGNTYTGDPRYTVQFKYPGNWRLQLTKATPIDEGLYECQLSTYPPRVITVNLHVNSVLVSIVDEGGGTLKEKYYEAGSTLALMCQIRGSIVQHHVDDGGALVWWVHGDKALHRDTSRGGVAVTSMINADDKARIDSMLRVSRLTTADAGNYTCALPSPTAAPRYHYTVLVHVLNESLAELQQGQGNTESGSHVLLLAAALLILHHNIIILYEYS